MVAFRTQKTSNFTSSVTMINEEFTTLTSFVVVVL